MPVWRPLARLILYLFLGLRGAYYFLARVFFCEPLFKAYCTRYGKNLHTGVFLHWVQGRGDLILGDNVSLDGKSSFMFAARYAERPTFQMGDNSGAGHLCSFTVGKRISIGNNCRLAGGVHIFDSPGHPADKIARRLGQPLADDEVKPVTVEDDVWIGAGAVIFPGVTIGCGSIVAAGAVVMNDVPANVLVAGNPARQVRALVKAPPA